MTTTAVEQTKERKGGAPRENTNSLRHGLYSPRSPRGHTYLDQKSNEYRRALEVAVLDSHGEVSVYSAGLIQTAVTAVRLAMKAQLWQTKGWDEMDWPTRLSYVHAAVKALESRARCIRLLKLDQPAIADAHYGHCFPSPDPPPTDPPADEGPP